MRLFVFTVFASVLPLMAADFPVTVEDSGSKEVDALVLHLVSTRPAPHPTGYTELTTKEVMTAPYMTTRVSNAIARLKSMGTPIFPALVTHLQDDRYSFSTIVASWENMRVGDAVVEVLSDGHFMFSGYKWRRTPSASEFYLSFKDYLRARGPEKWADWAKSKTRLEVQLDFIDWCVSKEKERGFTDEAQRNRILDTYDRAREEVKKEYSDPSSAAKRSLPFVH